MHRSAEEQILGAGQFGMKADAELDHRADARAATHRQPSFGRPVNARNQTQERALARSVASDDADGLAGIDGERDVTKSPELLGPLAVGCMDQSEESLLDRAGTVVPQQELLRQSLGVDHARHQTCSASRSSVLDEQRRTENEHAHGVAAGGEPHGQIRRRAQVKNLLIRDDERRHRAEQNRHSKQTPAELSYW